ncbi:hypothetical protein C772_02703 [Bhargavaea cecembensis DSE10]|uniref:Uncharacterized protein n=1 Tax=Bhargavaea cecembensis DSE10 TaxID=1235279 RepID=M7NDM9_9BACL|nr:hypothetical protein C772_02703 [Bhargavaea cecembensis DSE10]
MIPLRPRRLNNSSEGKDRYGRQIVRCEDAGTKYRPTVESKTSILPETGRMDVYYFYVQDMAVIISTKNEMIKMVMRMLTV